MNESLLEKSFRNIAIEGGISTEDTLKMYDSLEKWIKEDVKIPDDIRRKMRQVRILNQQNKLMLEKTDDETIRYTEFLLWGLMYEGIIQRKG